MFGSFSRAYGRFEQPQFTRVKEPTLLCNQVDDFLDRHPKVHLHFTPTYSSWLNQIELWFAKIERDVIARGVFTSVPDLRRKLMKYIRHYNNVPKTVKWRYFDPTRRITPSSAVTVH